MKAPNFEQELKAQLVHELCLVLDGYSLEVGAAYLGTDVSELSRLRHGDLRRFSLTRIVRFIARMRYDVEVHLKKTPRLEERPQPRHRPTASVVRYDYYGRVTSSPPTRPPDGHLALPLQPRPA